MLVCGLEFGKRSGRFGLMIFSESHLPKELDIFGNFKGQRGARGPNITFQFFKISS